MTIHSRIRSIALSGFLLTAGILSTLPFSVTAQAEDPVLSESEEASEVPGATCVPLLRPVVGATNAEWKQITANGGSLFNLRDLTPAEAAVQNAGVFEDLKNEILSDTKKSSRRKAYSLEEIRILFAKIRRNPQVNASLCGTYKKSNEMGFCFGRAVGAHLLALRSGLQKESVRKIWAVGDMRGGGVSWRYHVTTIVRGSDKKWYALDPNYYDPMPIEAWTKKLKNQSDPNNNIRIFSTPASRFGPSVFRKYNRNAFESATYSDFFTDLLDGIEQEHAPGKTPWADLAKVAQPETRKNLVDRALETIGIGPVEIPPPQVSDVPGERYGNAITGWKPRFKPKPAPQEPVEATESVGAPAAVEPAPDKSPVPH